MPADPDPPRNLEPVGSGGSTFPVGLVVPIAVMVVLMVLFRAYVVDDAYILLRYGRNLAEGFGLTFNPGAPPVEGYSNLLFVILAGALLHLGIEPLWPIRILCMAGALACVPLVWRLARSLGVGRAGAWLACLALAITPSFSFWSVSGLETTFFSALLTAAVCLMMRESAGSDIAASLLFFFAALTRPEAPVFFIAAGLIRVAHDSGGSWRGLKTSLARGLPWAAPFVVAFGAYTAFRFAYFDSLLPNPVYFKGSLAPATLSTSVSAQFVEGWWPYLLAASLMLLARRYGPSGAADSRDDGGGPLRTAEWAADRADYLVVVILAAIAVFLTAQPVVVGGVGTMAFFDRYFVPVLPLLFVAAAVGVGGLARRVASRRRGWGAAVAAGAWALLIGWQALAQLSQVPVMRGVAELETVWAEQCVAPLAGYINARYGPGPRVAIGDIGLSGYLLHGTIYDLFGLTSREFTQEYHRDADLYLRSILRRRPDVVVLSGASGERGWKPRFYADIAMMENPEFRSDYVRTAEFGRQAVPGYFYLVFERRGHLPGS